MLLRYKFILTIEVLVPPLTRFPGILPFYITAALYSYLKVYCSQMAFRACQVLLLPWYVTHLSSPCSAEAGPPCPCARHCPCWRLHHSRRQIPWVACASLARRGGCPQADNTGRLSGVATHTSNTRNSWCGKRGAASAAAAVGAHFQGRCRPSSPSRSRGLSVRTQSTHPNFRTTCNIDRPRGSPLNSCTVAGCITYLVIHENNIKMILLFPVRVKLLCNCKGRTHTAAAEGNIWTWGRLHNEELHNLYTSKHY
jgi:hypothetical protein